MIEKLAIIAGSGDYPRLLVEGAHKAGVPQVDVVAIKGSTSRRTALAADHVRWFTLRESTASLRKLASEGYDGVIMAGQISPMSIFRGGFDREIQKWLDELKVKNAHTIFGKLIEKLGQMGLKVLPASLFMDDSMPGVGRLTARDLTAQEASDIEHAKKVAHDMGLHDVGQTVMVRDGMVLAVEAFEGTNAAIKRGGKLSRRGGSIVYKAARDGHDFRFDIPVIGLKTLKTMRKAGATAIAFQAGRQIVLQKDKVLAYANKHSIAIVGVESGLPPAPLRP